MFTGFLKKDGLLIYEIKDSVISPVTEKQLKGVRNIFEKKVLVISRELTLHTKKNYPTLPIPKLKKALKLEIGDIFSIPNPQYHLKIFEVKEKTTTVDIWCWKSEDSENIKAKFPFQYIIPEDILWIEQQPTLNIFKRNGVYHLIASNVGKFLGALSLAELTEREIEFFIAGLPQQEGELKIKLHGNILTEYSGNRQIERVPEKEYPQCLENLKKINLKDFRVKAQLPVKIDFLLRLPIYGLIVYSVFLYASINNYDTKIAEINSRLSELSKKISSLEEMGYQNYQMLNEELNKKILSTVSPLSVMDVLAERIPIGCLLNRIVINEKTMELSLTYERPLDVVELLESAPYIKSVTMKGSPVKQAGKNYNFTLTLELVNDGQK